MEESEKQVSVSRVPLECKVVPIYAMGKLPQELCVEHVFLYAKDLKNGKEWKECKWCGKKINTWAQRTLDTDTGA